MSNGLVFEGFQSQPRLDAMAKMVWRLYGKVGSQFSSSSEKLMLVGKMKKRKLLTQLTAGLILWA